MKVNRTQSTEALIALMVVTMSLSGIATNAAVVTASHGGIGTFGVSATDLMNGGESTLGGVAFTGTAGFGSHQSNINDGVSYLLAPGASSVDSLTPTVGSVLTVTFDVSVNTNGYDIASVVSLTGFTSSGRTDQGYTLEAALLGAPTFFTLATVNEASAGYQEVKVTVSGNGGGALASGVEKLRFTFANSFGDAENMYREFDVFGSPTVPEPSTTALLGLGGWLWLWCRRNRE